MSDLMKIVLLEIGRIAIVTAWSVVGMYVAAKYPDFQWSITWAAGWTGHMGYRAMK